MYKRIALIALLVLLAVGPACATTAEYNTTNDSGGGGLALNSHILFNVTVVNLVNMTDLQSITQHRTYIARPKSDTSNLWLDGSAPFTASVSDNTGLHQVGSGTISSVFVSNNSPTTGYYEISVVFSSWDKSGITGGTTGQKHVNLSYDYAELRVVPAYRNTANTYPVGSLSYNTSAFLSYESPTDTNFYVPMGLVGWTITTVYTHTPRPIVVDFNCNAAGNTLSPHALFCSQNVSGVTPINQTWVLNYPGGGQTVSSNTSLAATVSELGWYGVNLTACSSSQCDVASKPNLFNLTSTPLNTSYISFWVHIYDPLKSAKIANSDLIVRNTTSFSSFRYISSTVGSFLIDSTYVSPKEPITAGQYVNLTGIAPGYQTGNATVSVPYDGWEYNLNLIPTADVPTGANATLIVQAIDLYTSQGVEGATITISNNTIPYSSSMLTNVGGSATFANIAAGTYQIAASKTGYQSSTTSWPAGASTVTSANIGLLPVGATPVVTGTAGNPLFDANGNPIVGYDANGNPITAAPTQDTRTASEKDEGMMDLLRNNGESLIMLFIVFTIIYMIKGIAK